MSEIEKAKVSRVNGKWKRWEPTESRQMWWPLWTKVGLSKQRIDSGSLHIKIFTDTRKNIHWIWIQVVFFNTHTHILLPFLAINKIAIEFSGGGGFFWMIRWNCFGYAIYSDVFTLIYGEMRYQYYWFIFLIKINWIEKRYNANQTIYYTCVCVCVYIDTLNYRTCVCECAFAAINST